MTAEVNEADRRILDAVEQRMEQAGLRGHVYLTKTAAVIFATRQRRTEAPLERNVGPQPILAAINETGGSANAGRKWLTGLRHRYAPGDVPAPALGNTPRLVATGCMPSRALCAVLEHRGEYDDPTRTELMREAGLEDEAAAARVFRALMQRDPGMPDSEKRDSPQRQAEP